MKVLFTKYIYFSSVPEIVWEENGSTLGSGLGGKNMYTLEYILYIIPEPVMPSLLNNSRCQY